MLSHVESSANNIILYGRHNFAALYGNVLLGASVREAVSYSFDIILLLFAGWGMKIAFISDPKASFCFLKMEFRSER